MRYQLDLTLRCAEGTLVRVLGTAERRGFQPLSIVAETQPTGDRWTLRLTVKSDRPCEALQTQLAKLFDCLSVEVSPCH